MKYDKKLVTYNKNSNFLKSAISFTNRDKN